MYEGTRDQPMPGPFPASSIFKGKALGTRLLFLCTLGGVNRERISTVPSNGLEESKQVRLQTDRQNSRKEEEKEKCRKVGPGRKVTLPAITKG